MIRKPTDDIANWRLQQENRSKPFPYVFPQMPPRFRRCCAFAKAVFLIQWGCFAVSCVCSMVLFIPMVIWGRNMGMSAMIENRPFLAFFIVSEILLSQRHSTAGTVAASVGKHMGMVSMYSPAVIASLQYHLWVFSSSCPLIITLSREGSPST